MKILVTGGTGYIGSHTVVELLNTNHQVCIVDDLSNSSKVAVERIAKITGKKPQLEVFNLCDAQKLRRLFSSQGFDAVVHFAGHKALGESVVKPLKYYENNLVSTINLLKAMEESKVGKLIFSSSATVYGAPAKVPITEDFPVQPTNPYGQTKAMIEQILEDTVEAGPNLKVTSLRYFNPIGAHPSGLIGEDPNGVPNNLLPFVSQVAIGKHDKVKIFGDNYDTPDGTGVRDYIHVVDLAQGHLAALEHIGSTTSYSVYNLGTGIGYSVKEVIKEFETASGKTIPTEVTTRRPGDIATCYADPDKANTELQWKATKKLSEACVDAWRWQTQNPNGFEA